MRELQERDNRKYSPAKIQELKLYNLWNVEDPIKINEKWQTTVPTERLKLLELRKEILCDRRRVLITDSKSVNCLNENYWRFKSLLKVKFKSK